MRLKSWTIQIVSVFFIWLCMLSGSEASEEQIQLEFVNANTKSRLMNLDQPPVNSFFFHRRDGITSQGEKISYTKTWYKDIYPGIDMVSFGDDYSLEYVFIISPGADPALIKLVLKGIKSLQVNHTGSINFQTDISEIIQSKPIVFRKGKNGLMRINANYNITQDNTVSINLGKSFYNQLNKLNGTQFNIVPGRGQPGGPEYDFYMSKFEITNEQFIRFLNNAQANNHSARGSNMVFDDDGNVWFNIDKKEGRDEIFSIDNSKLIYNASKPLGSRYNHKCNSKKKVIFAYHPVTGISWYGAVKYCNWLTIESGRGVNELCYREGTNALDWAPVTATNWANGVFSSAERKMWLSFKGFRLPMLDSKVPEITTNAYNEYYKAAAWNTVTNKLYGFGRNKFDYLDANYLESKVISKKSTFPVGFFNGINDLNNKRTRENRNYYGIYDLSGNVAEWMNDHGLHNYFDSRAICGGSWAQELNPNSRCWTAPAYSMDAFSGFRVVTTYLPKETFIIHFLYSFYMEPEALKKSKLKKEPFPEKITKISINKYGIPDNKSTFDISITPKKTDDYDLKGVLYKTPEEVVGKVVGRSENTGGSEEIVGGGVSPPPPPLTSFSVSLSFNPNNIAYADFSTLTASPLNGVSPYITYEFEYRLVGGGSAWLVSVITDPVTTMQWPLSVEYHVRVQDSSLAWSDWSNVATLTVGLPNPGDPVITVGGF